MALLIRGGQVFNNTKMAIDPADILIEDDRIAAVGIQLEVPPGTQELDATGQIILPGLVNAHTHSHNNLMKGLADNWVLEDLLNHGPALYGHLAPEEQYLLAALGAIEMIKTGCTAAYDQFVAIPAPTDEAVEAVARAYTDVGLRVVLAPCLSDIVFYQVVADLLELLPPDFRRKVESIKVVTAEDLLQVSENAIRRWNGSADGRIHIAVAPTIPGHCSEELLKGCVRLAYEYGVGIHTHLAETKVQAVYGLRRWGKTIVAYLSDIGMLGPGFVGGHGVWLTDEDMRQLADAGAMIAHNPASNLKLGSGIAPVWEMLKQGVIVGLGTDGSMSSDNQNMFEAMRFAALVSKIRFPHRQECWIGARDVWKMATEGSARILGMEGDIGTVAPGAKADLVLLQADSVFLRPLNNAVNALVYCETGADVATVLVGGQIVFRHGRVLTVDEARLRNQAQEIADRLRTRNAAAWAFAEQLTPYIAEVCRAAVATPYCINRYAASIV